MATQKVWLITGAAKGFGLEFVKAALASGDKVIATVRSQPEQLAATLHHPPDLFIVQMDVTNEAQVQAAVQEGIAHFGRLDVVINNAGYGLIGGIEEATDAETRRQYDTNVFGLLRVTRAVLPTLRQQQSGHLINISSLFSYDARAGVALYGSTKFAVRGISQGLAVELAPFGIHVTDVAPGLFSTEFVSSDSYALIGHPIADYGETPVGQLRTNIAHYHKSQPGDPQKLAQLVVQLVAAAQPPLHLPIGQDAVDLYQQSVAKLKQEITPWLAQATSTDHVAAGA